MTAHLGYDKHHTDGYGTGNSSNGKIAKAVQTGVGPVPLAMPRDEAGSFPAGAGAGAQRGADFGWPGGHGHLVVYARHDGARHRPPPRPGLRPPRRRPVRQRRGTPKAGWHVRLERLNQDNSARRQIIVNVIRTYLGMPPWSTSR
ncbi:transposase [Actinomadura verrucosospora]|uniref:transposase n=1 Tax=Actinomadura verrucosospora TaxID=46165 RepID=UPI0035EFFFF1